MKHTFFQASKDPNYTPFKSETENGRWFHQSMFTDAIVNDGGGTRWGNSSTVQRPTQSVNFGAPALALFCRLDGALAPRDLKTLSEDRVGCWLQTLNQEFEQMFKSSLQLYAATMRLEYVSAHLP